MRNNFVAVDFETSYGHIPCSIGIVEFVDGVPINEYYSLIKPIDLKFSPINPSKNGGIYLEDVINEREFDEIWVEISHFFENRIIVAHNASTDISILNKTLIHYKIEIPSYLSFCTLKIAQRILNIESYGLSSIANYFNITQEKHHHAKDDALVCGQLFLHLSNNIDDNKVKEFGQYKSNIGFINQSVVDKYLKRSNIQKCEISFSVINNIENAQILGKTFVVSGIFEQFSRDDLKKAIEDNGGKVGSSISAKTDYVVAGDNMGPAKLEKANQLKIPIISENDFIAMLQ